MRDGEDILKKMANSVKKNYLYNLMYEMLAILVPVITTPYISRVLGATAIGDYNYTTGIVSYFGLVAVLGTVNFAQREIPPMQKDKIARSRIFWEIFLFRLISIVAVTIAYFVFFLNFMQQYKQLFCIQLLTVMSWIFDVSWYFRGVENFKVTALRNVIVKILGTCLIFLLVKTSEDLWFYVLICSGTQLLGNLTMLPFLKREVQLVGLSAIRPFRGSRQILELFLPMVAIQLYTVFDKTMLGALCNTTEVGYYSQAEKIIKIILTVLSSLIAVLLPRFSALYNSGDKEKMNDYYVKTLRYIFMISIPMLVGCILVSPQFVPIFFGEGYEPVVLLMQVESLLFVILALGQLFGNVLVAMRMQNNYTAAVTIAAGVNLILNFLFIRVARMNAVGATIASVIAEMCSTGVQYCIIRKKLRTGVILKTAIPYLLPSALMAMVILGVQHGVRNEFVSLILSVSLGVVVYFGCLLIQKEELLRLILHKKGKP